MRRIKTKSHVTHLKCVTCARKFSPGEIDYTCPDCGPLRGTLSVQYDYDAVKKVLTRASLAKNREATQWRYLPILPIDQPEFIQPLAVGWTPLYHSQRLADEWGIKSLWVKDDGRNPSASYKDRASSVAVVKALEKGVETITVASTGNAASALAAFTAMTDLQTVIFVPQNAPRPKLAQLLLFGANVVQVKGTYDDAFDLCTAAAEKWGWYNRSTAINPYLGEGKKTGALEISEQLDWNAPDYVFVSVGDGCIFQGVWKGFCDFFALGLIDKLPKMIGVQAAGAAPLVNAWESGADHCRLLTPQTVADSISVGVPRDQIKALQAARESGGRFVAVSDAEILAAIKTLAQSVGVMGEPAGATALAGVKKCADTGLLRRDDAAVAMITGNGLKDIDGVMKAVDAAPVLVGNALDEVAAALKLV